ncbi:DUF6036 family nucleotidyltransferase [Larkinella punicea]|uniref:DUF6036 domain-containing protein n=1 Tax=Larkinella punicea TaxID=2315727 RepID=A0A368JLY7_9BACT|nr:DUF6036 family nucleotidyltransferase [Larkinella punicea]RCR68669.1 hypothetical protein DUE52_16320 [Larkinella punicea]
MDVENSDFLQFVASAEKQQLEYMLVGGLALLLNGAVRFTQDADLWLQPTNVNKEKLLNVLQDLGYSQEDTATIGILDFTKPQIIRIDLGPIDIMTRVHFRFNYEDCRSRAQEFITKAGYRIRFIGINDLREIKILARRPKDLNDVLMIDEVIEERKKLDENKTDNS